MSIECTRSLKRSLTEELAGCLVKHIKNAPVSSLSVKNRTCWGFASQMETAQAEMSRLRLG
jgi:hypothetical protein